MPSSLDRLVGISQIIDATSGVDHLLLPMRKALRFKGSGFLVEPADDAINITLTGVGGATGPAGATGATGATGAAGTLKTIGRLDATHSPVVLWSGDGTLNDASGNGRNAAVDSGTILYADLWPGYRGFSFSSCRIKAENAAFQITGDITIEGIFLFDAAPNGSALFGHDASGETLATNALYMVFPLATRLVQWFSESGAGVDVATTTSTPMALPPMGVPFHYCVRRLSNVVRHYVNGLQIGTDTATLTAPAGGTSGSLFLGGATSYLHPNVCCGDFKVIASALSDAQVLAEAQRSIGQLYVV